VKWREQVVERAARYGGTVDWGADGESLSVDAPPGFVWSCDGVHALSAHWDSATYRREVLADLWERLSHGMESCPVSDCDTCEQNRADHARAAQDPEA